MRSPCTTTKSSPHSPQLEKAHAQQWSSNAAKDKINLFKEREKKKKGHLDYGTQSLQLGLLSWDNMRNGHWEVGLAFPWGPGPCLASQGLSILGGDSLAGEDLTWGIRRAILALLTCISFSSTPHCFGIFHLLCLPASNILSLLGAGAFSFFFFLN